MNKRQIVITEDGSSTLELIGKDEHFHSMHGAIQESEHIYIQFGLAQKSREKSSINIFEMGFGTGLNALLSILFSMEKSIVVNYLTIEAFPLEMALVEKLNYNEKLNLTGEKANFLLQLHQATWRKKKLITPSFSFEKQQETLENFSFPNNVFDVVYFDAFNPDLQAELWTEEIFRKLYLAMKSGGILMTYSAKGKVKRALKAAGFVLNALPGPPGKREITQALKR